MSTAVDARRRPDIWSYINFGSSSRRRSVSLPTRSSANDPFEKANRHQRTNGHANGSTGVVDNIKGALMTQSQRSRYLKTGGIIAFIILLLFFLAPGERASVREFVGSTSPSRMIVFDRGPRANGVLCRPWKRLERISGI